MKRFLMNILGIEGERTPAGKRAARSRLSPRGFVPGVEALDDRVLPACVFQVGPALQVPGHRLTITGDNLTNNLVILDNGTAGVNNVIFRCNGGSWKMPGAAISEVFMNTGGGHDSVVYKMRGNVLPNVIRHVSDKFGNGGHSFTAMVKSVGAKADVQFGVEPNFAGGVTGSGDDQLQALVQGNVAKGADLEFACDGGAGSNRLVAKASNVNVAKAATLLFTLQGDFPGGMDLGGHNSVFVNYSGQMDGTLTLDDACQGGSPVPGSIGGRVDDAIYLNNGSTGTVKGVLVGPGRGAVVRGGWGNDWLRFRIHAPPTAHVDNASIQGDGDLDMAIHTSNVSTAGNFSLNQVVPF